MILRNVLANIRRYMTTIASLEEPEKNTHQKNIGRYTHTHLHTPTHTCINKYYLRYAYYYLWKIVEASNSAEFETGKRGRPFVLTLLFVGSG